MFLRCTRRVKDGKAHEYWNLVDNRHLVGTPKGRLTKLERSFLDQPWASVREGVQVKQSLLLAKIVRQ